MSILVKLFKKPAMWFGKREALKKLDEIQQSQKEGREMKLPKIPPVVGTILAGAAGVLLEIGATYLSGDLTPTLAEAKKAFVFGLAMSAAFWLRNNRPPTHGEIVSALSPTTGNVVIKNDDPNDPIRIEVDGKKVPEAVVVSAMAVNAKAPK